MFHVFLPSNSPVEENVTGNYTVRLPNTIDLSDGEWSVALSSIIYPISYVSGENKEMTIKIDYYDSKVKAKVITIPSNITFTSIEHLQKTLNGTIMSTERAARHIIALAEENELIEKRNDDRSKRDAEDSQTPATSVPLLPAGELKKLQAAVREVEHYSFKNVFDLSFEVEKIIVEIEKNARNIVSLKESIRNPAQPQNDFTEKEASDFHVFTHRQDIDTKDIREQSQRQRTMITTNKNEYTAIMHEMEKAFNDSNVSEARKIANKAKEIGERTKKIYVLVNGNLKLVENILKELREKNEELKQLLKPMDIGTKNNIDRIKKAILNSLEAAQQNKLEIYFYYDQNLGRFFLYNHKPAEIKAVYLSKQLAYILGFETDDITDEIKHIRMRHGGGFAKYTPDITNGIHQLYVYSPGLIESSYVGNTQTPLLRIINVDKPPNTVAESIYTNM